MTHAEAEYEHADKAIGHYQRLLAGALSSAERHTARRLLIKAVFQRAAALQQMKQIEQVAA